MSYWIIEYPGYPKDNFDGMIQTLGGTKEIRKAFKEGQALALSQSSDSLCHKMAGPIIATNNVLISVEKQTNKRTGEVRLKFSLFGAVKKTCRYRDYADFQVLSPYTSRIAGSTQEGPLRRDPLLELTDAMKNFDYDTIFQTRLDFCDFEDIPPPPIFSRIDYQMDYLVDILNKTLGNVLITVTIEDALPTGFEGLVSLEELVGDTDTESLIFNGLVLKIKALFDERPIWTRLAINSVLNTTFLEEKGLRQVLPYFAYQFTNGPWKGCYVKYGVDPRSNSDYRIYQIAEIRSARTGGARINERRGLTAAQRLMQLAPPVVKASHLYKGEVSTTRTFQLIDLIPENFTPLVNSIIYVRAEMDPIDGWYVEGHVALIRGMIRDVAIPESGTHQDDEVSDFTGIEGLEEYVENSDDLFDILEDL